MGLVWTSFARLSWRGLERNGNETEELRTSSIEWEHNEQEPMRWQSTECAMGLPACWRRLRAASVHRLRHGRVTLKGISFT